MIHNLLKQSLLTTLSLLALSACTRDSFERIGNAFTGSNVQPQSGGVCPSGVFNPGVGFDGTVNMIWSDTANCVVYVSGDFTHYQGNPVGHLVRLYLNGSIDPSFQIGSGPNNHLNAIVPMTDGSGRIYMGGNFTIWNGSGSTPYIVRLLASGLLDTTFNPIFDGIVFRIINSTDGTNQIYVTGMFNNADGVLSSHLARLNSDGSLDQTFAVGSGFDGLVQNGVLVPNHNDQFYAVGDFANYQGAPAGHIVRLNHDGSADNSFAVGNGFGVIAASVYGISTTDDGSGRIYVNQGGNPAYPSGPSFQGNLIAPGVTRLNADGSLDGSFNIGAGFLSNNGAPSGVYNVTVLNDGSHRLYAAGYFNTVNGFASNNLARLNSDGSVDTTLAVGALGFDAPTFFVNNGSKGSGIAWVFGPFANYQGNTAGGLIQINNSDGSVVH